MSGYLSDSSVGMILASPPLAWRHHRPLPSHRSRPYGRGPKVADKIARRVNEIEAVAVSVTTHLVSIESCADHPVEEFSSAPSRRALDREGKSVEEIRDERRASSRLVLNRIVEAEGRVDRVGRFEGRPILARMYPPEGRPGRCVGHFGVGGPAGRPGSSVARSAGRLKPYGIPCGGARVVRRGLFRPPAGCLVGLAATGAQPCRGALFKARREVLHGAPTHAGVWRRRPTRTGAWSILATSPAPALGQQCLRTMNGVLQVQVAPGGILLLLCPF